MHQHAAQGVRDEARRGAGQQAIADAEIEIAHILAIGALMGAAQHGEGRRQDCDGERGEHQRGVPCQCELADHVPGRL